MNLETLTQHAARILTTRTGLTVDLTTLTVSTTEEKREAGVCWETAKGLQIGINLGLHKDESQIIATLVHELIHAAIGCEKGHNQTFQKYMKLAGLWGIHQGQETLQLVRDIYAALGWELKRRP